MDDDYDDSLRENDPYNDMESGQRRSIMPDFLALGALAAAKREEKDGDDGDGGAGEKNSDGDKNGDDNSKYSKDTKRDEAAKDLRDAEDSAAKPAGEKPGGRVKDAKENEESPRGLYTGGNKPASGKVAAGKAGAKSKIKKYAPMGIIVSAIMAVGSLMAGSQALMPTAIAELIIDKLNSVGISSTAASDVWLDAQLNYGVTLEYVGTQEKGNLFAFSDEQKQSFEEQGIKVIDTVGNGPITKITALLYKKYTEWIPVVGSHMLKYEGYTESDLISAIREASGISNIGRPIGVSEAMKDEEYFKFPYTAASKTWRGGVSGWFDTLMSDITEIKLNVRRNRWASFLAKQIRQTNAKFKEIAADSALERTTAGTSASREEVDRGEDGIDVERTDDPDAIDSTTSSSEVERILNSKAMKAAQAVAGAIDISCSVVNGLMTIYTLVSAYQNLQFLNLISGFLEAVDKVKAGDGDGSPVHEYSTNLVTVGDTVDRNNGDGTEVVARKTAMESAGMAQLFTPTAKINTSDVSVQNVNIESILSNIGAFMGDVKTLTSYSAACKTMSVGTAAFGLATSIVSFIPLFGQGVKIAEVLVKVLGKAAIQAAAMAVISLIIPVATRAIVNMLVRNAATEWFGEDLGNALISGANKYLGGNGSTGLQSPAGETKLAQYAGVRDTVIAEEARYQRAMRSPLDITSRHTFMGSMVYSLMPLAYSGGVMSALSSLSSLAGNSIAALTPAAKAVSDENIFNSVGDCDVLESVGGVGDAFCNAYIVTDVSTITKDPVTSFRNAYYAAGEYETWTWVCPTSGTCHWERTTSSYTAVRDGNDNIVWPSRATWNTTTGQMIKHGPDGDNQNGTNFISFGFNEEGTNVLGDSDLAKYLIYCGERTSQYGIQDGTIADKITGGGASSILNAIPVIGDLASLSNAIKERANSRFISGQACVANSDYNEDWEPEFKYYQRYIENERLLENMYPNYTSPISRAYAAYHAENPIDTSFEGTLARFSGMTVEQVDYALALLDYYDYVANYDASERFAFGTPVVSEPSEGAIFYESETRIAMEGVVLTHEIIYADVRNRVMVV